MAEDDGLEESCLEVQTLKTFKLSFSQSIVAFLIGKVHHTYPCDGDVFITPIEEIKDKPVPFLDVGRF